MELLELLNNREAKKVADNIPLALGELSELIQTRANADYPSAIYVAVSSKLVEEKVRAWAQKETLLITSRGHTIGTVLCISWGAVSEEKFSVDARFLHNGKLVLMESH